jgi:hypothetical protein
MLTAWSKSPKLFVGADSAAKFLPGDDFPRTFQQDLQQFQWLLLDPDSHTRFAHLTRQERDLIGSESHDRRLPQWFHILASDGSLALWPGKASGTRDEKPGQGYVQS